MIMNSVNNATTFLSSQDTNNCSSLTHNVRIGFIVTPVLLDSCLIVVLLHQDHPCMSPNVYMCTDAASVFGSQIHGIDLDIVIVLITCTKCPRFALLATFSSILDYDASKVSVPQVTILNAQSRGKAIAKGTRTPLSGYGKCHKLFLAPNCVLVRGCNTTALTSMTPVANRTSRYYCFRISQFLFFAPAGTFQLTCGTLAIPTWFLFSPSFRPLWLSMRICVTYMKNKMDAGFLHFLARLLADDDVTWRPLCNDCDN